MSVPPSAVPKYRNIRPGDGQQGILVFKVIAVKLGMVQSNVAECIVTAEDVGRVIGIADGDAGEYTISDAVELMGKSEPARELSYEERLDRIGIEQPQQWLRRQRIDRQGTQQTGSIVADFGRTESQGPPTLEILEGMESKLPTEEQMKRMNKAELALTVEKLENDKRELEAKKQAQEAVYGLSAEELYRNRKQAQEAEELHQKNLESAPLNDPEKHEVAVNAGGRESFDAPTQHRLQLGDEAAQTSDLDSAVSVLRIPRNFSEPGEFALERQRSSSYTNAQQEESNL